MTSIVKTRIQERKATIAIWPRHGGLWLEVGEYRMPLTTAQALHLCNEIADLIEERGLDR